MSGLATVDDGRWAAAGNHIAAHAIGSGVDEVSGAFHQGAAVDIRLRLGATAASPPRDLAQKALLACIIWTELSIQNCASVVDISKGPKGQTPKVQIRNDRSPEWMTYLIYKLNFALQQG